MTLFLRTVFTVLAAMVLGVGCRSSGFRDPLDASGARDDGGKLADAGKYVIYVVAEGGATESLSSVDAKQREQVRAQLGKEMVSLLTRRGGYKAQTIRSRDSYNGVLGEYLLVVSIARYAPGSKAARMMGGQGSSDTVLDVRYEFYGGSTTPLLTATENASSGWDWSSCVRKIGENILSAVSNKLRQMPSPR